MRPDMSWMVAKLALPMTRLSIMRPATHFDRHALEFFGALPGVELIELASLRFSRDEVVREGLAGLPPFDKFGVARRPAGFHPGRLVSLRACSGSART